MARQTEIQVWDDTLSNPVDCRDEDCQKQIVWAQTTATGRKMCFDAPGVPLRTSTDEQSGRVVAHMDASSVHWATCPGSEKFRRERQSAKGN